MSDDAGNRAHIARWNHAWITIFRWRIACCSGTRCWFVGFADVDTSDW